MDLTEWRDEFPVLDRKTYLISASLGPIVARARDRIDEYLDAWASKGAPDLVWFEDIFPRHGDLKRSFAALAGCDPDELALTTNISIALSTIASCLDLSGTAEPDHPVGARLPDRRARLARVGPEAGRGDPWLRSADGLTIPTRGLPPTRSTNARRS